MAAPRLVEIVSTTPALVPVKRPPGGQRSLKYPYLRHWFSFKSKNYHQGYFCIFSTWDILIVNLIKIYLGNFSFIGAHLVKFSCVDRWKYEYNLRRSWRTVRELKSSYNLRDLIWISLTLDWITSMSQKLVLIQVIIYLPIKKNRGRKNELYQFFRCRLTKKI